MLVAFGIGGVLGYGFLMSGFLSVTLNLAFFDINRGGDYDRVLIYSIIVIILFNLIGFLVLAKMGGAFFSQEGEADGANQ